MKKSKIIIALALMGSAHLLVALSESEMQQLHSKFERAVQSAQFDYARQLINQLPAEEREGRQVWQALLQKAEKNYASIMQPSSSQPSGAMPLPPSRESSVAMPLPPARQPSVAMPLPPSYGSQPAQAETSAQLSKTQAELAQLKIELQKKAMEAQATEASLRKQIEELKKNMPSTAQQAQQSKIVQTQIDKAFQENAELKNQLKKLQEDLDKERGKLKTQKEAAEWEESQAKEEQSTIKAHAADVLKKLEDLVNYIDGIAGLPDNQKRILGGKIGGIHSDLQKISQ